MKSDTDSNVTTALSTGILRGRHTLQRSSRTSRSSKRPTRRGKGRRSCSANAMQRRATVRRMQKRLLQRKHDLRRAKQSCRKRSRPRLGLQSSSKSCSLKRHASCLSFIGSEDECVAFEAFFEEICFQVSSLCDVNGACNDSEQRKLCVSIISKISVLPPRICPLQFQPPSGHIRK